MSGAASLKIVSTGEAVSGFDENTVAAEFARLFGVSNEKATSFMGRERVIKKDLNADEAEAYRARLTAIGLSVFVQDDAANESAFSLVPDEAASAPSTVESGDAAAPEIAASERTMGMEAPVSATSDVQRPSGSTAQVAASRVEIEHDDDGFDDALTLKAILFAAAGAAIGALLWKAIALGTGYELGIVAWGLGGLVGFAAAMGGGKGNAMGVTCGALALLAIFGGKFLALDAMQKEFVEQLGGDMQALIGESDGGDVMQEFYLESYNENMTDANGYAHLSGGTRSIKQYMIDHMFIDAGDISDVTDEDVEYFRENNEEWLKDYAKRQLTFDQWMEENVGDETDEDMADAFATLSSGSTASMVFESLSPIDFLFILLGTSTAFSMGRGRSKDA